MHQNNIPQLRFKEFYAEWDKSELECLVDKISVGIATEVRPFVSSTKQVPLLRNQNIKAGYFDDSSMEYIIPEFDESNKSKRVKFGDVIIVRTGSNMGNACVVPKRFEGSQTFTTLIVRPSLSCLDSRFLSYHINYFGLSEIKRLSAGGGKPNLNAGFLKRYRINVGQKVEQRKIASFLTIVDSKIEKLIRKKELLEEYKKGVMQKLFSGEIRFKDENGNNYPDWEKRKLGEVLIENVEKTDISNQYEILSSTTKGLFLQSEYFDRSIASKDNKGYKIIKKNQLVFSPQNLWMGNINLNTEFEIGIVSPSYKVFNFSKLIDVAYFFHLMKTKRLLYEYMQASEQGASIVRRNLNLNLFFDIEINYPIINEQIRISKFLDKIDNKIQNTSLKIKKTKEFKKGLLQQMFV